MEYKSKVQSGEPKTIFAVELFVNSKFGAFAPNSWYGVAAERTKMNLIKMFLKQKKKKFEYIKKNLKI